MFYNKTDLFMQRSFPFGLPIDRLPLDSSYLTAQSPPAASANK